MKVSGQLFLCPVTQSSWQPHPLDVTLGDRL